MLEDFLTDENWMKAKKFRDAKRNGWTFEPLAESRAQWDRRYGPQPWNEMKEWDPGPRACGKVERGGGVGWEVWSGVEWCGGLWRHFFSWFE
jgi:hypothetical protein